jgi:hypothetical protein
VLVPVVDGHLTCDDGRGPVVAIVDDLHQVAPLFAGQRGNPVSCRNRHHLTVAGECHAA